MTNVIRHRHLRHPARHPKTPMFMGLVTMVTKVTYGYPSFRLCNPTINQELMAVPTMQPTETPSVTPTVR